MVSTVPGTSGAVAWYCRSEGDRTAHWPATGGDSVGMGLPGARSVENWTEIVASLATLSPVGAVLTTLKARVGRPSRRTPPRWWLRGTRTNPAAATASANAPARMTHRRGVRVLLLA